MWLWSMKIFCFCFRFAQLRNTASGICNPWLVFHSNPGITIKGKWSTHWPSLNNYVVFTMPWQYVHSCTTALPQIVPSKTFCNAAISYPPLQRVYSTYCCNPEICSTKRKLRMQKQTENIPAIYIHWNCHCALCILYTFTSTFCS